MRFFIQFCITLVILLVLWIALVYFQTGNPTQTSQWVADVYNKKTAIAQNIQTDKIVIVSGSNSLFGVDSQLLSEKFQKPVINLGVNAGVYLPYILFHAKKVIKKGDTVLLPLEYSMYIYDGIPNTQMIDYIFSRDFEAFFSLSLREQFYMIWNINFERIYAGYSGYKNKTVQQGLYRVGHIDNYGDHIGARKKNKSPAIQKQLDGHSPNKYYEAFDTKSLGWKYIIAFDNWCKDIKARCVFLPPTMMYFEQYSHDEKQKKFFKEIKKTALGYDLEFVGDMYDYMYPKEYYFNTDYHLSFEYRDIRTKQMIKDLSSVL